MKPIRFPRTRGRTFVEIVLLASALMTMTTACERAAPATTPAEYSAELAACTLGSKTCSESIACENDARARHGRPLRDPAKGCK
jgi:hypothetical protein